MFEKELLNQKRKEVYLKLLETRISNAKSEELIALLEKERQYIMCNY